MRGVVVVWVCFSFVYFPVSAPQSAKDKRRPKVGCVFRCYLTVIVTHGCFVATFEEERKARSVSDVYLFDLFFVHGLLPARTAV